jgi:DNA helicase HerA-like ATPase
MSQTTILIGGSDHGQIHLDARMANRHGLITGATGTGKTVTLQILAESFSSIGVPVFVTDIKGDLSGLSQPGKAHPKIDERIEKIQIEGYQSRARPTVLWDVFEKQGLPMRVAVSDMGPLLLSNLLELNDTQTGIMYACFDMADEEGLLLLDLNDLNALLGWMAENAKELRSDYGNISPTSIAAIKRKLLVLEEQGADQFLGEPAINMSDIMITDFSGFGLINILDATRLSSRSPRVYAAFLLWFLSELYENMPEVGDADKPKFVCFFDEAHMLFDQSSRALVDKIEQIVRLIRSKGVGIYFITQSPLDIPEDVLGQLGMRIQHALRAFTPKDKKAVNTIADTFRPNPKLDIKQVIGLLGTGEALVSTLQADGSPSVVERTLIRPPESQIGPVDEMKRQEMIKRSPLYSKYAQDIDRESAFELLKQRTEHKELQQQQAEDAIAKQKEQEKREKERIAKEKASQPRRSSGRPRQSVAEAMIKSTMRSVGTSLGRRIVRGILGSLLGK